MKIALFLHNQVINFELPVEAFENLEFDENEGEENKLINIKSLNNKWYIYSTEYSKVYVNDKYVEGSLLELYHFYIVEKDNKKNLIMILPIFDSSFQKFLLGSNSRLMIGNNNSCNIIYKLSQLDKAVEIYYEDSKLILNKTGDTLLYINNFSLPSNKIVINNGDKIQIYGLIIMIFNNIIFINNPANMVFINKLTANIREMNNYGKQNVKEVDIKNRQLYNENDYFHKSPRIKRSIEEKTIKIQSPPAKQNVDEIPLIYTLGPMLTTGVTSSATLANVMVRLNNGETTIQKSWVQIATGGAMLLTTILWPALNKRFQKHQKKIKEKERLEKYGKYLDTKQIEIKNEHALQKEILFENLIDLKACSEIIYKKTNNLWSRRIDQDDFLTVRIGIGNVPLNVKFDYSKEDFSMEDDSLKERIDKLLKQYEMINDVPVSYSFLERKITAIMGNGLKVTKFMESILLQLVAFHSYDDLKIVILTNKKNEHRWDFIKQSQHTFSDNKDIRFFASDVEDIKEITNYLEEILYYRNSESSSDNDSIPRPYYLIITDAYNSVKRTGFFKSVEEAESNCGFSLIVLENLLSRLPSKCNNFISIGVNNSAILEDAYESQKQIQFKEEINNSINAKECINSLANIPIEFDNDVKNLPNKLGFLEMYNVGKVEQLNVLNRWRMNDPTRSLKAGVGFDVNGNIMALDIHEKFHGPHGLIAGMTGSGKSEFIITYVLSLAINYSPEEVSFILIDYKGGGLAGAFENKKNGFKLPHLAGVITNLDKSELNRTLVSIDSEVRRRQEIFNSVRDELNESTIDIYKYQKFYREGKVKEPVSHLLVICDEFAELKSQQPDFMDNLISIARIGRSLGVHLILATQKPSGVVNDQIWSNSKFRVCLKVQDRSDSMEMLKRPEAAEIKNVGRFYLQVGYNEYFNLGQSAYCGTKYYPTDTIVKNVDRSIQFINSIGNIIKNVQLDDKNKNRPAQGEELSNILRYIISIANSQKLQAKKLWLESLSDIIYVDGLMGKYSVQKDDNSIMAIVGEYDDPENQSQNILQFDLIDDGNTLIYGANEIDKEMVLNSIIYSTLKYSSDDVNYYLVDYGSQNLSRFCSFPHVGDIVYPGDDEKLNNLFKMISEIIEKRKKIFSNSGKNLRNYRIENEKIPIINLVINNYDAFYESQMTKEETIIKISRDGQRYGVNIILTANNDMSLRTKLKQNFNNIFALRQNDNSNYISILGPIKGKSLRDLPGRGFVKIENVNEFQTSIIADDNGIDDQLNKLLITTNDMKKAKKIPALPNQVDFDYIKDEINTLSDIPIGVSKSSLDIVKFNFKEYVSSIVAANSVSNTKKFMSSLISIISTIKNINLMVIDTERLLPEIKEKTKYYYDSNFDSILDMLLNYTEQLSNTTISFNSICVVIGINKFKDKVDINKLKKLTDVVKKLECFNLIIAEDYKKIKKLEFDDWYRNIANNSYGIWVGAGLSDQTLFRLNKITKAMQENYPNDFGYYFRDSREELIKLIDFYGNKEGDDNVNE